MGTEKNSVICKGLVTGSMTMLQCIWATQIGLCVLFFFFLVGEAQWLEGGPGKIAKEIGCEQSAVCEIPR